MSIPRRRRSPLRIAISNIESAIADLEARVTALEEQEEDIWLDYEPEGNVGVGSSAPTAPTVTIPAETLVNLIQAQPINTSMSEGNVGIGSTAPDGNIGVGTSSGNVGGSAPEANVGIGSTAPDGNVGVGSSADGNVGVGSTSAQYH